MSFQRARSPEQVEARRSAILETARVLLSERPAAEISLRELSDRVGLAKSNVLRYFDSREAIFLELLAADWTDWLNELEAALSGSPADPARPYARETWVAETIAGTVLARPLLCDLASQMAGVLERNISHEFALGFKQTTNHNTDRLAELVRRQLPNLGVQDAWLFAGAVHVIVAGVWPYATPTETVSAAMRELGMPPARELVTAGLREGLVNQLVGASVRATTRASMGY
ncbi:TetR/AcrR family transcriptional regulator [Flindersiella endophytica]